MLAGAGLAALCGCQGLYFLMAKEPKKSVSAECDKLAGKLTAIVVWADQSTLDDDYAVRYRVADSLRYGLSRDVKGARFVDVREVTGYQERSGSDWEAESNAELAQRFKADYVLRVDLLEYTSRARDAREVRKGRVRATLSLYAAGGADAGTPVYSTEIMGSYPNDAKTDVLNLRDADILSGALQVFSEKAAQKFFDHQEAYP